MTLRRFAPLALLLAFAAPAPAGDKFVTENFVVDAPNKELARQFGEYAEHYRKEKALDWLGYEMPRWPEKCPLKIQVTMGRTGGATTFTFGVDSARKPVVLSQEMKIFGEVPALLNSVLPHEVTHTVLAFHFKQAVPRWADEGGSVLSENENERFTHDVRCREILNQGRGIPLRHLFRMTEYPDDMIVVYAQGYSICQYLIDQGGRAKFLQFVGAGMQKRNQGWEEAVQMYGYDSTDALQEAWITHLRTPPSRVAARNQPREPGRAAAAPVALASSRGTETRTSAVGGVPVLEPPVVARGQANDRERSAAPRTLPEIPRLLPPEPPTRR